MISTVKFFREKKNGEAKKQKNHIKILFNLNRILSIIIFYKKF